MESTKSPMRVTRHAASSPASCRRYASATRTALVAALLGAILVAGCGDESPEVVDPGPQRPSADSPENALRLMAEAFVTRDTVIYGGLFTSDYVFHVRADTMPLTKSTQGTLDLSWEQEMMFGRNCFRVGTSQLLPAQSITCDLGTLVTTPDERPGKDPTWHKRVACALVMSVDALDTEFPVNEPMWFYLVRGDSAATTPGIRGSGGLPEHQRWYIERAEPAPAPSYPQQFAALKLAYLVP